jgi:hypothetical protein
MDKKFNKLSNLVDDTFTVEKVWGYKFKTWDDLNKKMLVSDTYEKGYRKIYSVDTSEGTLDLSASQIGQMLESVCKDGSSELTGRTFAVKSNGQTGKEIRYYINPTKDTPKKSDESEVTDEELEALGW